MIKVCNLAFSYYLWLYIYIDVMISSEIVNITLPHMSQSFSTLQMHPASNSSPFCNLVFFHN